MIWNRFSKSSHNFHPAVIFAIIKFVNPGMYNIVYFIVYVAHAMESEVKSFTIDLVSCFCNEVWASAKGEELLCHHGTCDPPLLILLLFTRVRRGNGTVLPTIIAFLKSYFRVVSYLKFASL